MPGAKSNTKYRCKGCGAIHDFTGQVPTLCSECGHGHMEQIAVVHVCDFCSTTNARWKYDAEDFQMPALPGMPVQMSRGAWAACDECRKFIDANDVSGLVNHSITEQQVASAARAALRTILNTMYHDFIKHRLGEPTLDER